MALHIDKSRVLVPDKVRALPPRRRRWRRYSNKTFYFFLAPWLIGFVALTVAPLLYALLVSFTNFDGISGYWHWIGLANYNELFHSPDTLYSLGRTLLYTVITVPLGVAGGLALALLVNRRLRAVGLFRTIFYLPSVVPIVASAIMWRLLFDRDAGLVNALWAVFGGHALIWLDDPYIFATLLLLGLWGLGGGMVISLAGLQGIPVELQEAAEMDGATGWQVLWNITLPLLSPVLLFQVVTGVIGAFQSFIQPLLLSGGGNNVGNVGSVYLPRGIYFYMVDVYQQFFFNQRFGYGSAMLWILFLCIMLVTLVLFRSSSFWVYYEVDRNND